MTATPPAPPASRSDRTPTSQADARDAGTEASAESGQIRQAARGSAFNLIGAVVAAVISFFTVGLITNGYGQSGAGLFFAATALFTLAANGARLGAESSLTFFVSRLRADGRRGAVRTVTRTAIQATAAVSVGFAATGFAFAPSLAGSLAQDHGNVDALTAMIRILALSVPAFALSQAMIGASRGFGTMRPAVLAGQFARPAVQLALVAAVVAVAGQPVWLAVAWAGASVVAFIPISVWLRGRLGRITPSPEPFPRSEYWRFAAPRALTDLLSSALERLDLLLVAYVLDETQAGLYGTSNRLIVAGQLMMFATAQSMAPHLSANFVQGRTDRAKHVLHTVSAWNVTLLWPLFIGLAFGAEPILRLFGPDFTEGVGLVRIFAVSLLVIIGLGVGDTLLLMTGQSRASLVNHTLGLLTMVAMAAVLLPRVGVAGAAWAWAGSRILIRGLAVMQVWRYNGVHGLGPPVVLAAAIALAAYLPTGWLAHRGIDNDLLAIAVHAMTGGLVQAMLCLRFRDTLELDQLVAIVGRR